MTECRCRLVEVQVHAQIRPVYQNLANWLRKDVDRMYRLLAYQAADVEKPDRSCGDPWEVIVSGSALVRVARRAKVCTIVSSASAQGPGRPLGSERAVAMVNPCSG